MTDLGKYPTPETTSGAKAVLVPGTSPGAGHTSTGRLPTAPGSETARHRDAPLQTIQQPAVDQGDHGHGVHAFKRNAETPEPSAPPHSESQPHTYQQSIQRQVEQNPDKRALGIFCSCTNPKSTGEHIEKSDAVERMYTCFSEKLGYLAIDLGTTLSSHQLDQALKELRELKLPRSYCRIFFYYFGHGNDQSICLADKDVDREYIIDQLQSMCPSHPGDLFKIFLFDSCRTVTPTTTQPIQVQDNNASSILALGEHTSLTTRQTFPRSTNTLVINATDFNSKAYYINDPNKQVQGCGLVTLFFTELAPKQNASLGDVLIEVRKAVDQYIKEHPEDVLRCIGRSYCPQLLVYEHRLMGVVNLLAESTGTARVTPMNVRASPFVLNTNVHWTFADNAEKRIKQFLVEVTPKDKREDEDALEPLPIPSKEKFATISFLKPSTSYLLKVVAEYEEDGFLAKSEEYPFTTADRSFPQIIAIRPGTEEATVEWSFPGDITDLSKYVVKAETDGEQEDIEQTIDVQKTKFTFRPLHVFSKYIVAVTAVYRDGIEQKTSREFFHQCDLRAVTNLSATLIKLKPSTVELKWSYEKREQSPSPTGFKVVATTDESSTFLDIDPGLCQATLELKYDAVYMFKVISIYGEFTKKESEEIEFKSPSEAEGKPTIGKTENIQSNSVEITFTNPLYLQKTNCGERIQLTSYTVMHRPHGEENADFVRSTYSVGSHSTSDASPTQPHRMKLSGLMPGKKYKLIVKAHYRSEDPIQSEIGEFTTKSSCKRNCCLPTSILLPFFFCLLLIFSYVPLHYYFQGSKDCQTNYILSLDTIECGYGNSLQYDGAEIKGCPESGDTMTETLNVWQIPSNEVMYHYRMLLPVNSNGKTTEHSTFLLLGWQIYMWKHSVIAGYCCIANDNEEEKTASLHMFLHNEDAYRFEQGEGVKNSILSEQISVPPKKTSCFQKWGTNSPFTVTHSSYHYIGVDLPANMNYTANITVNQSYVNTSDYPNSQPKQFRRDNHTHFTYPHQWFHRIEYLYICKAPLIYPEHKSEPNSVSLHVCTCNEPYPWMKSTFVSIAALGGFGVLYILSVLTCYCVYTKWRRWCTNHHGRCWPCLRNTQGYVILSEPTIQA